MCFLSVLWIFFFSFCGFQNKAILEASYSTILFMGELGTAMIPKVMSNMICCINLVAMGESLMIGNQAGILHIS